MGERAECERGRLTGLRAMQLRNSTGQSLGRVDTDSGLYGIGEAGVRGRCAGRTWNGSAAKCWQAPPAQHRQALSPVMGPAAYLPGARPGGKRHRHRAVGPGGQNPQRPCQRAADGPLSRARRDVLQRRPLRLDRPLRQRRLRGRTPRPSLRVPHPEIQLPAARRGAHRKTRGRMSCQSASRCRGSRPMRMGAM